MRPSTEVGERPGCLGCLSETGRATVPDRLVHRRLTSQPTPPCRAETSTAPGRASLLCPATHTDLAATRRGVDRGAPSMRFCAPLAITPCGFGRNVRELSAFRARLSARCNQPVARCCWARPPRPATRGLSQPFGGLTPHTASCHFQPGTTSGISKSASSGRCVYSTFDLRVRRAAPTPRTVPAKHRHAKSDFTLRFASTRFGS